MMAAVFIYSLQVAICLGALYLFYYLALRNLTFYNWNRWYLFWGSAFCFVIPWAAALPWLESQQVQNMPVIKIIPNLNTFSAPALPASDAGSYTDFLNFWLPLVLFLGMLIQGTRLGIQFWSFYQLRRHATLWRTGSVNLYQVDLNIAPFSFGKSVFLNKNLLQPAELPEIIRHELVHIHQKHTWDVLWVEFLILLQWYNPFVYWWKRALRQNLEFIADRSVITHSGTDKKNYQHLLVKVIGLPALAIAQPFNISPLKTRIKMMNKQPSNKRELAKFLFALPVMAALLLACQEDSPLVETSKADALQEVAPPPPPPLPTEPAPQEEDFGDAKFLKRNPSVFYITAVFRNNNYKSVEVVLKSGKKEIYNLDDKTELAQFREKYGYYPVNVQNLPPPPPPVVRAFTIPFLGTDPLPTDYKAFLKRYPQVKTIGWDKDGAVIIKAISGRSEDDEVYDLNDPIQKAMLEKKYGELPQKPVFKK